MQDKKLWFKAKSYGWGWYPISWQGWVITFAYVLGIVKIAIYAMRITESGSNTSGEFLWNYFPPLILLSVITIWICYKTGEKPEWRWGNKN